MTLNLYNAIPSLILKVNAFFFEIADIFGWSRDPLTFMLKSFKLLIKQWSISM